MQERKHQEKTGALPELKTSVTEVLVASGRSFQPFIRTFSYTGENISKSGLGTLLGVFEIDDQSEDSAYIVNFLASVAKKEYFNNPRRGAIESFEAALHKINLALAELVKHGNVTWLGKLHGALGVLEKNSLHFSVTGHAKILLLRNGTLADISVGLASEESHIHPIKTFVEVSSGRLTALDQVLLSSPELLALFSLDELSRHAARMDEGRFVQFLKTALVNELDMSGLMIVDVTEGDEPEKPKRNKKAKETTPPRTENVFSQSAFAAGQAAEVHPPQEAAEDNEEKKEEYIDTKTGHIYVQGETPETNDGHPALDQLHLTLQDALHSLRSFLSSQGKWARKARKQALIALQVGAIEGQALSRRAGRSLRRQWRKWRASSKTQETTPAPTIEVRIPPSAPPTIQPVTDIPLPEKPVVETRPDIPEIDAVLEQPIEHLEQREIEESEDELPSFMKEKLALFYQRDRQPAVGQQEKVGPEETLPEKGASASFASIPKTLAARTIAFFQHLRFGEKMSSLRDTLLGVSRTTFARFQKLSLRQKQIVLGLIGALIGIGVLGLFFRPGLAPQQSNRSAPVETPASALPLTDDTSTASVGVSVILSDLEENIVTPVILNDEMYVVTTRNIRSGSGDRSFLLPDGNRAKFAAAMDDLRLIFIYTEEGSLYAWSPISKTFVKNTLALENGARVAGIGTYLTYLYVLDSAADQIYRFPRADGGFGAGTPWFKENVPVEETSRLSVNETLFITLDPSTIKGFFRGRTSSTCEIPEGGLSVTDLYTHPGLTDVYALDSEHQSVLIWNQDGRLIRTFSDDRLVKSKTLSVNEKDGEIFVGTENSLLSFKLK